MSHPSNKKRILSGMRPTGSLHLGHLVGALENWKQLQEEYHCFFMVADWHALMSEYERPHVLQQYALDNVIDWLSVGISPEKSTIFVQSQVKEHLELHMVLSCITPLGWLERCPTYKEQLRELKERDVSNYAFLGYPVLQAADILLYKAHKVPVGEDQLPHLELAREIARRFNSLYKDIFPEPEALLTTSSRLLGLDGRKMSKSYDNYIALSEEPSSIRKKVQNMFTDPLRVRRSDAGHPEKCNVHSYYAVFAPERKKEIDGLCRRAEIGCTDCKKELAEILIKFLEPIQEKRKELLADKKRISAILERGREKASSAAQATMSEVKAALKI
jgi:tryptophanyl-tRNA synthetase